MNSKECSETLKVITPRPIQIIEVVAVVCNPLNPLAGQLAAFQTLQLRTMNRNSSCNCCNEMNNDKWAIRGQQTKTCSKASTSRVCIKKILSMHSCCRLGHLSASAWSTTVEASDIATCSKRGLAAISCAIVESVGLHILKSMLLNSVKLAENALTIESRSPELTVKC